MTGTLLPTHPRTGLRAVGIVAGRPVWPIAGGDDRAEGAIATRLAEIDTRATAIRTELVGFAELPELDDDATARFGALETELETLTAERAPLAQRAETITRARAALDADRGVEHIGAGPQVQRKVDPFGDMPAVRSASLSRSDVQSRARAAIDLVPGALLNDDQRSRCEELLVTSDKHGRLARHMLLCGSDAYQRAFEAKLAQQPDYALAPDELEALRFADEHMRAVYEGTPNLGGYLVPFFLDPTIILTNAGSTNPIRQMATVKTITTSAWHGVTSQGVDVEWLAEAQEVGDHSPTFAQPGIPVFRAGSYIQASFEANQDTNIASEVGMLLADAKDNDEAVTFVTGNGTTRPKGVGTVLAATGASQVASAGAAAYAVGDVYKLAGALPPRHRPRASWLAEYNTYLKTRQFASGSGPQHAFWADLGMNTPPQLLGRPTYEASGMSNTLATGTIPLVVGDFSKYYVIDRVGMVMQFEPLVKGPNRRPTGEVGWFAQWRVGGDVVDPNAFRALKIA